MAGQKSIKVNADSEVNTTGLASVLGVTARRVQQLTQDGIFIQYKRGSFLLGDSVQRYITYKFDSERDSDSESFERQKLEHEVKLKKAKATLAEFEAEELKGNMHRSEDVEVLTNDMIYSIRNALNALPGRVAVDAAGADTPAEVSDIIRKEVHKIMRELASYEYDPNKYEERVRERMEWTLAEKDNADDE